MRDIEPVTAQSIAAAKLAQAAERQQVFAITGMHVVDQMEVAPYIIHCRQPGCGFASTARSEGRSIRALAAHICNAHLKEQKQ
jgi:hypothetical protein